MSTTPPDLQTPPPPGPDSGPRVGWEEVKDLGRLRRVRTDRRVAGVAGGVARHLDIDPVLVRVAFVVLTFFGGVGLLLYLALWLLVPEEGSDWATVRLDRRSRVVALVAVGLLALALLVSHGWWGDPGPALFLLALLVVVLLGSQLSGRDRHPAPPVDQPLDPPVGQPVGQPPSPPVGQADSPPVGQPAGQSYSQPVPTAWVSPDAPVGPPTAPRPAYVAPEQPRPVNPRKRGPILFWFALATMAVAVGILAVVDLAGASVAPSAYPATVLGLSAAFLLLGTVFGRAGGLILIGLLSSFAMVGTTVADHWDPHSTTVVPASASAVQPRYSMDVGELKLDLTSVRDLQALDGRTIEVDGNVGHLEVMVPPGVTVVSDNHVTGVGGINAFGRGGGGVDTTLTALHSGGAGAPRLTIDTELHVGGIDVHVDPFRLRGAQR